MKLSEAISILEKHNHWRRDSSSAPKPFVQGEATRLGIAIDNVILAAKECEVLINVVQQIANHPRKTRAQILASSAVRFLETMR